MSKISEVSSAKGAVGAGAVDYRTACLRLPRFPLQLLLRQRPEWREQPTAWLERLKPDAPVRFANRAAREAGLTEGVRYAAALGLLPDLRAGCHAPEELREAERRLVGGLHRFSPRLFRPGPHHPPGLYLLDASGLGRAFRGYRRWGEKLLAELRNDGWEPLLALGFSPFALETATYLMAPERPFYAFADRAQEYSRTLSLPLGLFELPPEAVARLRRFGFTTLEQLLALEPEELRRRFPGPVYELYERAAEALFSRPEPLFEQAPVRARRGFPTPVDDQAVLVRTFEELLGSLLPVLAGREEAVAGLTFALRTESGKVRRQTVRPNAPSLEKRWLSRLLQARLEAHLLHHPLAWSDRVEAVALLLSSEACAEEQLELFTDWVLEQAGGADGTLRPRDRRTLERTLAWLQAEFGEGALRLAQIQDSHRPDQAFCWGPYRVNGKGPGASRTRLWTLDQPPGAQDAVGDGQGGVGGEVGGGGVGGAGGGVGAAGGGLGGEPSDEGFRVRRRLARPVPWPGGAGRRPRLEAQAWGPYRIDGGWWEEPYCREYSFVAYGEQLAWLYREPDSGRTFVEGWLQ